MNYRLYSILISFVVFAESSHRWPELAMYMFPKFLETIPLSLAKVKRDDLINFKFGMHAVFSVALAITSHIYNKDPESIKKSMIFILDLIIGREEVTDESKLGKTNVVPKTPIVENTD